MLMFSILVLALTGVVHVDGVAEVPQIEKCLPVIAFVWLVLVLICCLCWCCQRCQCCRCRDATVREAPASAADPGNCWGQLLRRDSGSQDSAGETAGLEGHTPADAPLAKGWWFRRKGCFVELWTLGMWGGLVKAWWWPWAESWGGGEDDRLGEWQLDGDTWWPCNVEGAWKLRLACMLHRPITTPPKCIGQFKSIQSRHVERDASTSLDPRLNQPFSCSLQNLCFVRGKCWKLIRQLRKSDIVRIR